jgi:hypothetical protein
VTNAATGGSPRIDATGDDTNIDLTLAGKGTGGLVASFKQATGLGPKDSDSSHDLKLKTSSNLTASRTLDLITGDADRSVTLGGNLTVSGNATVPAGTTLVAANNLSDLANAATAFGTIKQAASDSATGVLEIADQGEMEAASDATKAVTPGRQHFHPGHPKAGGNFDGTARRRFGQATTAWGRSPTTAPATTRWASIPHSTIPTTGLRGSPAPTATTHAASSRPMPAAARRPVQSRSSRRARSHRAALTVRR